MDPAGPPPLVPVPAARYTQIRGRRVVIGVPGVGFRGDLRADDPVIQGSRTFVPVLTEQEYYRAELHHIEAFAVLAPIDRVWVEEPIEAPIERLQPLDAPPVRWARTAASGEPILGRRVVRAVPDGFIRDLRAVSDTYTSHEGSESALLCAESEWYAWALDGSAPTPVEVPLRHLWIE